MQDVIWNPNNNGVIIRCANSANNFGTLCFFMLTITETFFLFTFQLKHAVMFSGTSSKVHYFMPVCSRIFSNSISHLLTAQRFRLENGVTMKILCCLHKTWTPCDREDLLPPICQLWNIMECVFFGVTPTAKKIYKINNIKICARQLRPP